MAVQGNQIVLPVIDAKGHHVVHLLGVEAEGELIERILAHSTGRGLGEEELGLAQHDVGVGIGNQFLRGDHIEVQGDVALQADAAAVDIRGGAGLQQRADVEVTAELRPVVHVIGLEEDGHVAGVGFVHMVLGAHTVGPPAGDLAVLHPHNLDLVFYRQSGAQQVLALGIGILFKLLLFVDLVHGPVGIAVRDQQIEAVGNGLLLSGQGVKNELECIVFSVVILQTVGGKETAIEFHSLILIPVISGIDASDINDFCVCVHYF